MAIDWLPLKAGLLGMALAGTVLFVFEDHVTSIRETALDEGLAITAGAPSEEVIVVAIDEIALQSKGRWPWPRARLAKAVQAVAAASPAVIGLDLVLSGEDPAGKNALSDIADPEILAALPDGDAALQRALAIAPSVLGAALSNNDQPAPGLAPLLAFGPPVAASPWFAVGLESASQLSSKGLGVTAFQGDAEGIVRTAPLLVIAGEAVAPGFAAEVVRIAKSATAFRLGGGNLSVGDIALPMGDTAELRIRPTDPNLWDSRTIPLSLVEGGDLDVLARLSGKIVVLGLTAPQSAALRATAVTPVAPSVQIQADTIETMLSGRILERPAYATPLEWVAAFSLALCAIALGVLLGPSLAFVGVLTLAAVWAGFASFAWLRFGLAFDPLMPGLLAAVSGMAAITTAVLSARRRARAVQRRFERHLSPALVARISSQPGMIRLPGEMREVTVIFTDIQSFSTHAGSLSPMELIEILDRYFSGLTQIVYAHNGMIEKFVGDAAHILFNAPVDVENHQGLAIDCALAIQAFGQTFALDPRNRGFGITRVGVETGMVVVGDVGSDEKLDYTAHGHAMNIASRLEQAGKELGVTLVAGPAIHAALPDRAWKSLGTLELRSFGQTTLWTV